MIGSISHPDDAINYIYEKWGIYNWMPYLQPVFTYMMA